MTYQEIIKLLESDGSGIKSLKKTVIDSSNILLKLEKLRSQDMEVKTSKKAQKYKFSNKPDYDNARVSYCSRKI